MGYKVRDVLLFLAAVAGCVLLTLALAGKDFLGPAMIYNFVFLGIMGLLYLIALFGGFFRMSDIST